MDLYYSTLYGTFNNAPVNGMPQYPPPASSRGILGDYIIVHGKIKCPTLGPASPVKTPWYPLVSRGRGIVGHAIDRCIIARGRNIWIIYSLVPLREGIYHSYTPLVIVEEYT